MNKCIYGCHDEGEPDVCGDKPHTYSHTPHSLEESGDWEKKIDLFFPCQHHPSQCNGDCNTNLKRFILSEKQKSRKEGIREAIKKVESLGGLIVESELGKHYMVDALKLKEVLADLELKIKDL